MTKNLILIRGFNDPNLPINPQHVADVCEGALKIAGVRIHSVEVISDVGEATVVTRRVRNIQTKPQ